MSELTEKGKIIKGYKATNQDLTCQGYKFEVGEWHEHDGDVELCKSGFHFCPHMSGVWTYYPNNPKIWKVEAELVLLDNAPGADLKYVAKRIRLVKEVKIGGDGNTGDRNTGDCNTGNRNTGDGNTGNRNTGNRNTGDCNTGNRNTTATRETATRETATRDTATRETATRETATRDTATRDTSTRETATRETATAWIIRPISCA